VVFIKPVTSILNNYSLIETQVNKLPYVKVKGGKMSFIHTGLYKPIKLFKGLQDIKQSFIQLNLPPTFTLTHT